MRLKTTTAEAQIFINFTQTSVMGVIKTKEPQFITNGKGQKLSVVLPIGEYRKMLEKLEELEDIRLYDAVKARNEKTIPFDQYVKQRIKKKKNA